MEIRNYLLNKLFFPKVVKIDQPGIILSKTTTWYGKTASRKRIVTHFEDIFVAHQLEAVKKLGEKKARELYYRIGKEVGFGYMILGGGKTPPKFMIPAIVKYIFPVISGSGYSCAKNIEYQFGEIILTGDNCLICRKSHIENSFAGLVSGILTFLEGRNIEIISKCKNCPENCRFEIDKLNKTQYIVDINDLMPKIQLNNIKLLDHYPKFQNSLSYSDLIRFKKLIIDNKGKILVNNCVIAPSDITFFGIIVDNYSRIKELDILKKSIVNASVKIGNKLFLEKDTNSKFKEMCLILSALGYGFFDIRKSKDNIRVIIKYPPSYNRGFDYVMFMINGFINSILRKKYNIKNINKKKANNTIELIFML